MNDNYPILEFDECKEAIIEPSKVIKPLPGIPEFCVLPFYYTVIDSLLADNRLVKLSEIKTAIGPVPVYMLTDQSAEITVALPGLGAPFAAGVMEELIAAGCRKFVACGAAGVMVSSLARGTVVVPNSAVRDEGTSYQYLKPDREVSAQMDVVKVMRTVLEEHHVPYREGKTWTTDAFYRETKKRIAKRTSEGCLTVEMECAALFAVAEFRGVRFGQMLSIADDVSGVKWDRRHLGKDESFSEKLFWLAVEACLKL